MSRTPEIIESAPLKLLHNVLGFIGVMTLLIAVVAFTQNGNFIVPAILGAAALYAASRIKYQWVKQVEGAIYK